jgi:curved DNA-binding protein CbpA
MANHYEVLGVTPSASPAEIRKAYAQVAREKHPDRFSDPVEKERAQELFKDATAAFNTLSNEKARHEYDAELHRPKATTPEEQAELAYKDAVARLENGDAAGAAESLKQAAYLRPQEARYHAALGRVLKRDPRAARAAIQSLEEATRLDPSNVAALVDLAQVYRAQGLAVRARKAAEAAALIAPRDAAVVRLLAELKA